MSGVEKVDVTPGNKVFTVVYDPSRVSVDRMLGALEKAGEPTSAGPKEAGASSAPSALRHLDLGYAIAALGQAGVKRSEDWASHLEKAAALRPDAGAIHFAVALAAFDGNRDRRAYLGSLRKALDLASDPKGLLRKNLVSTFGKFLDAPTFEALDAKVRERLGSS